MTTVNISTAANLDGRIDVARILGSSVLAMYVYDLGPGQASCPYRYEYEKQRLLLVDGSVVVRRSARQPSTRR